RDRVAQCKLRLAPADDLVGRGVDEAVRDDLLVVACNESVGDTFEVDAAFGHGPQRQRGNRGRLRYPVVTIDARDLLDEVVFYGDIEAEPGRLDGPPFRRFDHRKAQAAKDSAYLRIIQLQAEQGVQP